MLRIAGTDFQKACPIVVYRKIAASDVLFIICHPVWGIRKNLPAANHENDRGREIHLDMLLFTLSLLS